MIFQHTFTEADTAQYVEHIIPVSPGTRQIDLTIDRFSPRIGEGQVHENQINLVVFDPAGNFRGWRYSREGFHMMIGEQGATYGFLPGMIIPGNWRVVINIYRVLPPSSVAYSLRVETAAAETVPAVQDYKEGKPSYKGAGWYTGDLHCHTFHSDGKWTVRHLNAFARRLGLDFVHLSDHNTVSGNAEHRSLSDEDFVAMAGIELSTPFGHAVAVGTDGWEDWGVRNTTPFFRPVAEAQREKGHFVTIAHPKNVGEPYCGGCRWVFVDDVFDQVSGIEVWNGPWNDPENHNELGLAFYYELLNLGHRLTATSGTDSHGFPDIKVDEQGRIRVHWVENVTDAHIAAVPAGMRLDGIGLNVVWAEEFSEAGIIAGLKAGHSFVSDGPRVTFTASAAGEMAVMMGDTLPGGQTVSFTLHWKGCRDGDRVRLIRRGEAIEEFTTEAAGTCNWQQNPASGDWYTVEIRNARDGLRTVTNPIYLD